MISPAKSQHRVGFRLLRTMVIRDARLAVSLRKALLGLCDQFREARIAPGEYAVPSASGRDLKGVECIAVQIGPYLSLLTGDYWK